MGLILIMFNKESKSWKAIDKKVRKKKREEKKNREKNY